MKQYTILTVAVALLLVAVIPAAQAATQQDVAEWIRINVLGGSYGTVNLWISDGPMDETFVVRDATEGIPDTPMPFPGTWFVLIDDEPEANWGHPCRWVFVEEDTASGLLIFSDPPIENDYFGTILKDLGTGDEVPYWCTNFTPEPCGGTPPPPPALVAPEILTATVDDTCLHAVLVSGGGRRAWCKAKGVACVVPPGCAAGNQTCLTDGFCHVNCEGNGYGTCGAGLCWGSNHKRYADNLKSMYQKLRACGYPKNQIWVYYSDGTLTLDLDGDGANDVTASSAEANIRGKITNLCQNLDPDRDVLTIYITNHGTRKKCNGGANNKKVCNGAGGCPGGACVGRDGIWLWDFDGDRKMDDNEVYEPAEFAADTKDCKVCRLFVIMDQCYSGLFLPLATDGNHKNMSIYVAATADEPSWGREYPAQWEKNDPSKKTADEMHKDVKDNGGLRSTPGTAEGTAGNGAVTICFCWEKLATPVPRWIIREPPTCSSGYTPIPCLGAGYKPQPASGFDAAAADTVQLAWYSFDNAGQPDQQGWISVDRSGRGTFAELYSGVTLVQEDPCFTNLTNLWAWLDEPGGADYACGGWPTQPAVPFNQGVFLNNEIWSPEIPYVGAGDELLVTYLSYGDMPLDNLLFYSLSIRSIVGTEYGPWRSDGYCCYAPWYFALQTVNLGALVEPGATSIQLAFGVQDLCGMWCGILGTGLCHSHGPLFDEVRVARVNKIGPQFIVRHVDLFQDNFAENGTLTGTARADVANDIASRLSPTILPGDSVTITVAGQNGIGVDPFTLSGPAVYAYVAVWPPGEAGKSGPELEAADARAPVGPRYPVVDSVLHDGVWWYCFRMDSALNDTLAVVPDRYAFDLNDNVFTPGDTICYVFCAEDGVGNRGYWSRRLNGQGQDFVTNDLWEALASPCEFTILPAGGWKRGGDILYVDDADDRLDPPQLFYDTAFEILGIAGLVDRYDVLSPSSLVGNSPGHRVKDVFTQLMEPYRKIIWDSGNLSAGLVGDGGVWSGGSGPDKADDAQLLFEFLDQHPAGAGLFLSGDDLAQELDGMIGAGASNLKANYLNYLLSGLAPGDHVASGEPVSPLLEGIGPCFQHFGVPDSLIAYGGCPQVSDFDLLAPTGIAQVEFYNPNSLEAYVISQVTPNAAGDTARVILSGFSYASIHSSKAGFPDARTEFLADIIDWLDNSRPVATAVGDTPQLLANYLDDNYPNPFNPVTMIAYGIKERGHVSLKIYNVAGQLVRTLVDEVRAPAGYRVPWNGQNSTGQDVASGVYFYKLVTKEFTKTKKMVLLK